MYKNVFILCPAFTVTGGTELLHQLAHILKQNGQKSFIVYTSEYENSPAQRVFGLRYDVNIANAVEDNEDNLVIVPESDIRKLIKFKYINRAIWWLSVDNYQGTLKHKYNFKRKFFYKVVLDNILKYYLQDKCLHFVQSQYAYDYVTKGRGVQDDKVRFLSDYLNPEFIEETTSCSFQRRNDIVLYNPLKGFEFTSKLIQATPDIEWRPIKNMTSLEIKKLMLTSKIYVDFGNHPGKDRIPREAAMCGLIVITGKKGSAGNNIDVPIPPKYKFEEYQINEIVAMLHRCIREYDDLSSDFSAYRTKIISEYDTFVSEVHDNFLKI